MKIKNNVGFRPRLLWLFADNFQLFCAVLFAGFALSRPIYAASSSITQAKYDPVYVKVSASTLSQQLQSQSTNANALVVLIQRGDYNKLDDIVMQTIDEMRRRQPNNAKVLAAYCYAYHIGDFRFYTRKMPLRRTEQQKAIRDKALERAKAIEPTLWLTYVIEGYLPLMSGPTVSKDQWSESLTLLQQAVQLSPRFGYPRNVLANAYIDYAANVTRLSGPVAYKATFLKAASQLERSLKLKPVSSEAAMKLYQIYAVWAPDRAKARRAARAYYNSFPPGHKFSSKTRKFLSQYS